VSKMWRTFFSMPVVPFFAAVSALSAILVIAFGSLLPTPVGFICGVIVAIGMVASFRLYVIHRNNLRVSLRNTVTPVPRRR
jgi:hypothetical protein